MKGQGMAQKTVFSEGRTLWARIARPYSCHGISSADMGGRVAVGLMETCLGQAQAFFNGRAEPASRHKARRVKGNLVGRAPGQAKVAVFRKSSWDPLTSAFGASPKVGMLLEGK